MKLNDPVVELTRERRDTRRLIVRHRDDDRIRLEGRSAGVDEEPVADPRKALDARTRADGEPEPLCVRFEEIAHRVLRRERAAGCREPHPVQPVVPSRREEAKRVPSAAPRIADARARVQDHEGDPCAREVIPHREARLSAADDHSVHPFGPSFALGLDGRAPTAACASGELCKSSSRARGYFCVGDSDEVVLVRVRGRGRPAREAELREDVADVACNRLLA